MRYSRYVLLQGIIGGLLFLVLAAVFLAVGGSGAAGFVVFFGVIALLGFGLSVAWAHRAVEEFDGTPFPGLLGVLGVDIVPDEVVDAHLGPEKPEKYWVPGARAFATSSPGGSTSATARPIITRRGCNKCGGVTAGGDSRYCRLCGAPFET